MGLERYRVWLKDDTYEVAVVHNREEAIDHIIARHGVKEKNIVAVGKATNKGKLFYLQR